MDVFILRHGKAEDRAPDGSDAGRALTVQGREDIRKVGRWITGMGYEFDIIATSPLKRARETAEIIAAITTTGGDIQVWEDLAPGGDPDAVSHRIGSAVTHGSLLIVGHEPMLSALISRLVSENGTVSIDLAKGAVARIKGVTAGDYPAGALHSLVTPKQIP